MWKGRYFKISHDLMLVTWSKAHMTLRVGALTVRRNPTKFGVYRHFATGDIKGLLCKITWSKVHMTLWVKVFHGSHHPSKFRGYSYCGLSRQFYLQRLHGPRGQRLYGWGLLIVKHHLPSLVVVTIDEVEI